MFDLVKQYKKLLNQQVIEGKVKRIDSEDEKYLSEWGYISKEGEE